MAPPEAEETLGWERSSASRRGRELFSSGGRPQVLREPGGVDRWNRGRWHWMPASQKERETEGVSRMVAYPRLPFFSEHLPGRSPQRGGQLEQILRKGLGFSPRVAAWC